MRRVLSTIVAMLLLSAYSYAQAPEHRKCGLGVRYEKMAAEDPAAFKQMKERQLRSIEADLAMMDGSASKTTAQYPIPVVFHFILTQAQYNSIGNDTGIVRRVASQLKVLNADFNGANSDANQIPAAFASLYSNVGIKFGLAKATNANTISAGIELKVLASSTIFDVNTDCYTAKHNGATGLNAWDVTKYLNIWVVNITNSGSGFILGITTAPSSVGYNAGGHVITGDEIGVVLNYGATGSREFGAQYFITGADKGRTITHEMGHYFEVGHTWGDDGGLCPSTGGQDDGFADTPPEADATYCNKPPGNACPTFPTFDSCTKTGNGIMYMNFMDYVDDRAMLMFTTLQKQRIVAQIQPGYPSWSLTQNPDLATNKVPTVTENAFRISPNPATGLIKVNLAGSEKLKSIDVVNMMGQSIARVPADGSTSYDIALANAPRGIYFVQCHFAEGTLAKKIVLE